MAAFFFNRAAAGRQLAEILPPLDPKSTIVLALPRGGVPVAAEICHARDLQLDLAMVRKIGLPGHPELAVAAVIEGPNPQVTINKDIADSFGLTAHDVQGLALRELPEIARRKKLYLADRPSLPVKGKTVVVVDDGIATGASMRAVLLSLQSRGVTGIVLALPVGPNEVLQEFESEGHTVICLHRPRQFHSVGAYYTDFTQVADEEVAQLMNFTRSPLPG